MRDVPVFYSTLFDQQSLLKPRDDTSNPFQGYNLCSADPCHRGTVRCLRQMFDRLSAQTMAALFLARRSNNVPRHA